jgi:hypothetical protein
MQRDEMKKKLILTALTLEVNLINNLNLIQRNYYETSMMLSEVLNDFHSNQAAECSKIMNEL